MSLNNLLLKEHRYAYKLSKDEWDSILFSPDGFDDEDDEDDAREFVEEKLNSHFPEGFIFNKSSVFLYRLLFLDKLKELNKDKLGQHWTGNPDNIYDSHYVWTIRQTTNTPESKVAYVLIINISPEEIDIVGSLHTNVLYPEEEEITLNPDFKPYEAYICKQENFNNRQPLTSKGIKEIL